MRWKLFACLGLLKVNTFIIWIQAQSFQWPTVSVAHWKSNRKIMPVMLSSRQNTFFFSPSLPLLCALNMSTAWYNKSACQWFMKTIKVCLDQHSASIDFFYYCNIGLWLLKYKNVTDFICKSCKSTKIIQIKELVWRRHLWFT